MWRWTRPDPTVGSHRGHLYLWSDATYLQARSNHRIVSRAVVVATGVTPEANREALDLTVGESEDEVFWDHLAGQRHRLPPAPRTTGHNVHALRGTPRTAVPS